MKNVGWSFTLAALLLFCSSAAFARESGAYLAFGLGHSEAKIGGINYTSVGAGIMLGAQVNKNLALEIEYVDFGEMVAVGVTVNANSQGLSGLLMLPLTQHTSVYLKAGVARMNSLLSGTGLTGWNTALSILPYGLGVQYELSPKTTIRIFADEGYGYQVTGTTTTVGATNVSYSGGISRVGLATLYTF